MHSHSFNSLASPRKSENPHGLNIVKNWREGNDTKPSDLKIIVILTPLSNLSRSNVGILVASPRDWEREGNKHLLSWTALVKSQLIALWPWAGYLPLCLSFCRMKMMFIILHRDMRINWDYKAVNRVLTPQYIINISCFCFIIINNLWSTY